MPSPLLIQYDPLLPAKALVASARTADKLRRLFCSRNYEIETSPLHDDATVSLSCDLYLELMDEFLAIENTLADHSF